MLFRAPRFSIRLLTDAPGQRSGLWRRQPFERGSFLADSLFAASREIDARLVLTMGTKFFRSEEGRIFVVGCCMIGLWFATIAVLMHRGHAMWSKMLTMGFAHMLAGRAASIAQGTQAGLPSAL